MDIDYQRIPLLLDILEEGIQDNDGFEDVMMEVLFYMSNRVI